MNDTADGLIHIAAQAAVIIAVHRICNGVQNIPSGIAYVFYIHACCPLSMYLSQEMPNCPQPFPVTGMRPESQWLGYMHLL